MSAPTPPRCVSRAFANWSKAGTRLGATMEFALVNGQPGAVFRLPGGELASVMMLKITGGKVSEIFSVVNPDKLQHLGDVADLKALLRGGSA